MLQVGQRRIFRKCWENTSCKGWIFAKLPKLGDVAFKYVLVSTGYNTTVK